MESQLKQHQPVEADGDAAAVGKPFFKRFEKALVEGVGFFARVLPGAIFRFEALSLFQCVGQLVIAVRKLDAFMVDFEALCDRMSVFLHDAREGGLCLRIVGEDGQLAIS